MRKGETLANRGELKESREINWRGNRDWGLEGREEREGGNSKMKEKKGNRRGLKK